MNIKTFTMPVIGLTCSNCALMVESNLLKLEGIIEVKVDLAGEKLKIVFDSALVNEFEIIKLINKIGYRIAIGKLDLPISGLHDQTDSSSIEKSLLKHDGILSVNLFYSTEQIKIEYIPGMISISEISGLLGKMGYELIRADTTEEIEDVEKQIRTNEINKQKKLLIIGLVFTLPLIIYSMLRDFKIVSFSYDEYLMLLAASVVQFIVGWQFYKGAFNSLKFGAANMDVLIVIGSSVAFFSSLLTTFKIINTPNVYYETGAAIITLIRLGKYLESRARGKSSEALKELMSLKPKKAFVIKNGIEVEVNIDQVEVGDLIVLRPGGIAPVDGIICEGRTTFEEAMITGESMPVIKSPGDEVFSSTINREGSIKFEATKVGKNTTLSNIIRLVQEAQNSKASIQKLTDEIGKYFVPIIIAMALFTFLGWIYIAQIEWTGAMINAISVIVIACPCAIGLATPTAIMVGTSNGAKHGILFKNSEVLEKTGKVNIVVFDKTGTLTNGKPEVTDIIALNNFKMEEVLQFAASSELGSEHPIGQAIVKKGKDKGLSMINPEQFQAFGGFGIKAFIQGNEITVGNPKMMLKIGIDLDPLNQYILQLQSVGKTVMIVAMNLKDSNNKPIPIGIIAVADEIKPGAKESIVQLRNLGLDILMLTGDNQRTADAVAKQLGIDRVMAEVLPGDKAECIKNIQITQSLGNYSNPIVAMVGDGINDAPALAQADVGIAIGSGTDIAKSVAGITLIGNDIIGVCNAISLSRGTYQTIIQNLIWAFFYNIALIPIAAYGLLSPMFAAGAMAFSSIFVVTNSLGLRSYKINTFLPKSSILKQSLKIIPKIIAPAIALAILIIAPMLFMPGKMEIKGALVASNESPLLMMVMAIANALIAVSYASIPFFLIVFVKKRKDMPFTWIIFLFGLFILACGITHFVHIFGLWLSVDWWQAIVDSICAVVSIATAVTVWPVLPKLLSIPSPEQLRRVNNELEMEKDKLVYTQNELQIAFSEIENRVKERTIELVNANKKLQNEIYERKLAEEKLSLIQFSVDHASDAIFWISPDARILDVNKAACISLGYTHDELIQLTVGDIDLNYNAEFWQKHFLELRFKGSSMIESLHKRKDGTVFPIEIVANHVIFGNEERNCAFVRNISERKQTENALIESETKFRVMFENSRDAIGVSANNIHVFANPAYLKLFRYENPDLLIGVSVLENIAPSHRHQIEQNIQNRISGKNTTSFYETRGRRSDGSEFDMEVKVSSFELNNIYYTLVTIRDITERKQAEIELINAKVKAEESDKLKTAFLQNVSHEIRTPLNGILGFSNLLQEENISKEEIKEFTGIIQQSGNRLLEIVNNVLDISKIETGQIEFHNKSFSINSMMADLYSFFSPRANSKNIIFNYHNYLDNLNSIIYLDDSKLNQILNNLISNAIKFTQSGKIDFGYEIKDNLIIFYVKDTGIGISKKHLDKIFDRFTQIDLAITKGFEGAGLGLAICKGLVELLNGKIWVESKIDKGSSFYFSLQLNQIKQEQIFIQNEQVSKSRKKKSKILIVEDDYASYTYLNRILKSDSIIVLLAENGEKAVEIIQSTDDINLILMDIRMPVMNGFEATKQIKNIRPNIPIIAQTAYAFSEERNLILSMGCDDYLSKPINAKKLNKIIEKYL